MMDSLRFRAEQSVLTKNLPEGTFEFHDMGSANPYLEVIVTTVTDNQYLLRIELKGFPESKPSVYIQAMCPYGASSWREANLENYQGESLKNVSASNHTLAPHPDYGWVQICHYNPSAWRSDVSLWFVYLLCSFWLNAYEYSIMKRIPLDAVLKHQGDGDVY